jgi:hypothetical protein
LRANYTTFKPVSILSGTRFDFTFQKSLGKAYNPSSEDLPLSRVIKLEGAGKDRTRLMRSIVLALRELMKQTDTSEATRDLAAYISMALQSVGDTIEESVAAWEKRDYWVKADRFRMEWAWTTSLGTKMQTALLSDDWAAVALTAGQVAQKVQNVDVPVRHKLGAPWEGAWAKLKAQAN